MYSHTLVEPVIKPGVEGLLLVMVKLLALLVPQPLAAVTVMALEEKPLVKLTVTVVSFTPGPFGWLIVVVPACAVHAYEVAPITLGMVYVIIPGVPITAQTFVLLAVIAAGVPGACASK